MSETKHDFYRENITEGEEVGKTIIHVYRT